MGGCLVLLTLKQELAAVQEGEKIVSQLKRALFPMRRVRWIPVGWREGSFLSPDAVSEKLGIEFVEAENLKTLKRLYSLPKEKPVAVQSDSHDEIKNKIIQTMQKELSVEKTEKEEVDSLIAVAIDRLFPHPVEGEGRIRLIEEIKGELFGLGLLEPLMKDESITEILVNGTGAIYVERKGCLEKSAVSFPTLEGLQKVIDRIVMPLGRRLDEASPTVDGRLADGSRVHVVLPPLAIDGPHLTIRRFAKERLRPRDLLRLGTLNEAMLSFLEEGVKCRLNILISGGTGSGKTTLLNILSSFIPEGERIITIEDSAELALQQEHTVRLEARPPNIEGKGTVTVRDLVRNCLRMRPDRIIVGECRGAEAIDMLQAMNTGHSGSLTTVHANAPRDALSRLETLVLFGELDLPMKAVREQIASAIDLIVHVARTREGSRKIMAISKLCGLEGNVFTLQEMFRYENGDFQTALF